MANINCSANTPINHQYYITDYGSDIPAPTGGGAYVERFTAESFALRQQVQTVKDEGTGSPWDVEGAAIESRNIVNGTVTVVPRPDQMSSWIQDMLGNAPAGNVYKPAGEICEFYHIGHYDPVIDRIFQYNNCVTNTWSLSASDSSPLLRLELNVEAGSRELIDAVGGTVAPTGLPLSLVQPFVFCYLELTVDGTAYRVKDISISGNNNLDTEGFFNSCDRVEIPSQFQEFTLSHSVPFDGADGLALLNTTANVTAQAVFVSGAYTMTIDFPSLFARPEDPSISGRDRILLPIEWQAQYDPNVAGETPITITLTP